MEKIVQQISEIPEAITVVYIEAVSMPNGEIMCCGNSLRFKDMAKVFIDKN